MTEVCYTCGRPREDSDAEVSLLKRELDIWRIVRKNAGETYTVEDYRRTLLNGEKFTVLQKQTFAQEAQGETTDCFVVFRRESTGKVYKKLGKGDSYGELEWDGALFEVKVSKKMVETWEVVED